MRILLCLVALIALWGCDVPVLFKGQDAPRWQTTQQAPVITQQWQDGFVPVEDWKTDTLRIFGSGRWEASRAYAPSTGKPSAVVASGSISQEALNGLLAKAFERPLGGKSFLDLPERVDTQVADAPVETIAVVVDNGSHSVTVMGTRPEPYERFRTAIASQTLAVPFTR